jgi:hypothetical protein
MKTFELPKSISSLLETLNVFEMYWQGVPVQIPQFAVYAVIEKPIFEQVVYQNNRKIGLLNFGRYTIPVLDPFQADLDFMPNYALIISHARANRFGLYGYPADHVDLDKRLPIYHPSVCRIVRDYL